MKRIAYAVSCLLGFFGVLSAGPTTQPTTRPTTLPADQMLTRLLRPGGATAQPLGNVSGLDYSVGRYEQVTLYRVAPAQR